MISVSQSSFLDSRSISVTAAFSFCRSLFSDSLLVVFCFSSLNWTEPSSPFVCVSRTYNWTICVVRSAMRLWNSSWTFVSIWLRKYETGNSSFWSTIIELHPVPSALRAQISRHEFASPSSSLASVDNVSPRFTVINSPNPWTVLVWTSPLSTIRLVSVVASRSELLFVLVSGVFLTKPPRVRSLMKSCND